MKLIIDFHNNDTIKITCDEDLDNFYYLAWTNDVYSLWYNNEFVWEKTFLTTGNAVGELIKFLTNGMRKNK